MEVRSSLQRTNSNLKAGLFLLIFLPHISLSFSSRKSKTVTGMLRLLHFSHRCNHPSTDAERVKTVFNTVRETSEGLSDAGAEERRGDAGTGEGRLDAGTGEGRGDAGTGEGRGDAGTGEGRGDAGTGGEKAAWGEIGEGRGDAGTGGDVGENIETGETEGRSENKWKGN